MRPVLQGLGEVRRPDQFGPGQIGDGAGQLEHPVVDPCGESELAHGRFEQVLAGGIERYQGVEFFGTHVGIGDQGGIRKASGLAFAVGRTHVGTGMSWLTPSLPPSQNLG